MLEKSVYIWMAGGLGNQLFQYAAGFAVARRLNCSLKLDLSRFEKGKEKRQFGLSRLGFPLQIATKEELKSWRPIYRLPKWVMLQWGTPNAVYPKRVFFERDKFYEKDIKKIEAPIYLRGYFQSEKYFFDYGDEIRSLVQLEKVNSSHIQNILREIGKSQTVSVHFRLGDYVAGPTSYKFKGSCTPDYYLRAMALVRKIMPECQFLVFSDDLDQARKILPFDSRIMYVPGDPENPIEDLILMSRCHHHIIANSSFSWWGAWLNPNPEKVVIGPRRWLSREYLRKWDLYDILPTDWITLDS